MFGPNVSSWVAGWVDISPIWFVIPILLFTIFGSFAQGALVLYGAGLDASSVIHRLPRVQATLLLAVVGIALVYIGYFVYNLVSATGAFVTILVVITTPWMVINLIGHIQRKGWYKPEDLQVWNEGRRGGIYWFAAGWNLRALAAWAPATIVGLLFTQTTVWSGPWATAVAGIDMSVISSGVIAGVLYLLMTKLFPEPEYLLGEAIATDEVDHAGL